MSTLQKYMQRYGITLCAVAIISGCSGDPTEPPLFESDELYGRVMLNHHAVTLSLTAPYDTVQLHITPLTTSGVPLSDATDIRYRVVGNDPSVDVSEDGLVRALAPKMGVRIEAELTLNGITRKDSVLININEVSITPSTPKFDSLGLEIGAIPSDVVDCSMTRPVFTATGTKVSVGVFDAQQTEIPDANVALYSSNEKMIQV
jgi:hypothetical protein